MMGVAQILLRSAFIASAGRAMERNAKQNHRRGFQDSGKGSVPVLSGSGVVISSNMAAGARQIGHWKGGLSPSCI
jgi:hypothetical protein